MSVYTYLFLNAYIHVRIFIIQYLSVCVYLIRNNINNNNVIELVECVRLLSFQKL